MYKKSTSSVTRKSAASDFWSGVGEVLLAGCEALAAASAVAYEQQKLQKALEEYNSFAKKSGLREVQIIPASSNGKAIF